MTYNKDIPYNTLPTIPPQWMTQAQMAELFQCTRSNVNLHLQAIYREGELIEQATCKDFLQVRKEGLRPEMEPAKDYFTINSPCSKA